MEESRRCREAPRKEAQQSPGGGAMAGAAGRVLLYAVGVASCPVAAQKTAPGGDSAGREAQAAPSSLPAQTAAGFGKV